MTITTYGNSELYFFIFSTLHQGVVDIESSSYILKQNELNNRFSVNIII